MKDRKTVIKALKGKIVSSMMHATAHLVIMKLLDVTDDYSIVRSNILDEMLILTHTQSYTATGRGD